MHDDVFGEIDYDYGWFRGYSYEIFDRAATVKLTIPCDEGDEIEPAQREAFTRFEANKDRLVPLAERAMFDYYTEIVDEYRERLGPEFADKMAPRITSVEQLAALVEPTEVIVQQSFSSGNRVVGLLFSCSWDPELGLAVKFVSEAIEEVGTQDIVL